METRTIEIDGYRVWDTLLEGVTFLVDIEMQEPLTPTDIRVSDDDKGYLLAFDQEKIWEDLRRILTPQVLKEELAEQDGIHYTLTPEEKRLIGLED